MRNTKDGHKRARNASADLNETVLTLKLFK